VRQTLTLALGELAYFLVWATVALILVGVPVLEGLALPGWLRVW